MMGYNNNYGIARVYFLGAFGTIVEWYDFSIYGHLSTVLARLFFVDKSPWLSLTLVYAIFFISYLARPLGALLYGYIGDYYGRRPALLLSITMMTASMLVMMFLPTWHVIGGSAPILLLIFRIIQGLSAGGETSGAFVYILESVNHKRYGLFGSLTWAMIFFGVALGSGIVALLSGVLTDAQLLDWGWRLAYLIGAVLGVIILLLRVIMPESLEFAQAQQANQMKSEEDKRHADRPLLEKVFFQYKYILLIIIALGSLSSASYYFTFFYLPQYINKYLNIKLSTAMLSSSLFSIGVIVANILFGYFSDFLGKKRMMMISAIGFLFLSYPIFYLMMEGRIYPLVVVPLILMILVAMYKGPLPGVMIELTPLNIRYTLVSLGYNISTAIFGGASLLISSSLIHWTHNPLAPGFYLMIVSVFSLTALFSLSWLRRNDRI